MEGKQQYEESTRAKALNPEKKHRSADIKVSQISTDFFRNSNCFRKSIDVFASSSKQGGVSKITNKNSKK